MSKSFNVDINSFSATNDMDSIYAGELPVKEEIQQPKSPAVKTPKEDKNNKTNNKNNDIIDHKKTKDAKGRVNKKNNYTTTIKIDETTSQAVSEIIISVNKKKNLLFFIMLYSLWNKGVN